ncbi:hypothetical protein CWI83_00805 [Pseudidiomarina taiwanensis]|uniref:Uncharacterized protein n=1 Tax=Pseudidiomarina taiwanensis TaxID=337250 RepID=A0A432ZMJ0_9GAMM|nr:hypothetical protein CWI83_00805 [Pseudidiomarina taiwanensis]
MNLRLSLLGQKLYYFIKSTVMWWLIFLGAIHLITTMALIFEWENQRDFSLDEHIRIIFISVIPAFIFSLSDAFRKLCVELKKRETQS